MTSCVLVGCSNILRCHESKVAVMWLEFLLYIRDVLVSNPDTGNTDGYFVDIVKPAKKCQRPSPFTSFVIHNSLFTPTLDALKSELLIDIQ
jgi:hypothetical protein